MRLLFVADGRSYNTLSWLRHWTETGHETHLVSTFPCDPPPGLASFRLLPAAFGGLAGPAAYSAGGTGKGGLVRRLRALLRPLRYLVGPLSLPPYQRRFRLLLDELQPHLVHALRIPFEGMLAAVTPAEIPLVVSIWGNDLTLHARGSYLMAGQTRRVLHRADGLMADANRDIRLGCEWGFSLEKPTLVVPGAGGIRLDKTVTGSQSDPLPEELPAGPIIVNPRGQRVGSLRQDIFFQSIPLVLEKFPTAVFVCPPLQGDPDAKRWVETLGIRANTKLWPALKQEQLWALYRKAQVFVSPSVHDGTPNSLLEAMACGCFPVVGDIESMQEWIQDGVNGLLVDATSPRSLADGLVAALGNPTLREAAEKENARRIAEHAEYGRCMAQAETFYKEVAGF